MPSRIGRKIDSHRLLSAVKTPSGTPITTHINTETAINEIVIILSDQTPTMPG
ncbi:unannotated protein [freshwater metagenome]|uniref:Unannotated protein n=1 Tax=freshwater metagenome TaxID=449393 RepID=A0A6J6MM07_9ZZZZ